MPTSSRSAIKHVDKLRRSQGSLTLGYAYYLYPLRIIKQVVTMMFSVSPEDLGDQHLALARFCLDRYTRELPEGSRVFMYYLVGAGGRQFGDQIIWARGVGRIVRFSEVSHPPLGFVMTWPGSTMAPDERLLEITGFVSFEYNQSSVVWLQGLTLPNTTSLPGDYRTLDEVRRQPAPPIFIKR